MPDRGSTMPERFRRVFSRAREPRLALHDPLDYDWGTSSVRLNVWPPQIVPIVGFDTASENGVNSENSCRLYAIRILYGLCGKSTVGVNYDVTAVPFNTGYPGKRVHHKQITVDLGSALPKPCLQERGIGYGKQRALAGD